MYVKALVIIISMLFSVHAMNCNQAVGSFNLENRLVDALNIQPATYGNFLSYIKGPKENPTLVVTRISDNKVIEQSPIKEKDAKKIDRLIFDEKWGGFKGYKGSKLIKKFKSFRIKTVERDPVSFNEVLDELKKNPYDLNNLPTIPLKMFRFIAKQGLNFFVGSRSQDVLRQGLDYRTIGLEKPIHPMGIGVTGRLNMFKNKYSGLLSDTNVPIIGRLSISQGNASKTKEKTLLQELFGKDASPQQRSVSIAIKAFNTNDPNEKVVTANAVFQNDLNGEVLDNFLDGVLTNQPALDIRKIRKSYEVLTLLGVAKGALTNPNDRIKKSPFINPQIRPVHQLAEAGVDNPGEVKTPTWLKLQVSSDTRVIPNDDFRLELFDTINAAPLKYEIYAGDDLNSNGEIIWEPIGEMIFDTPYLTEAADKNILFHHSALRSDVTGEAIVPEAVPTPIRQD